MSPAPLAACPAAVGICWVRSPRPWGHSVPGCPLPSWQELSSPFNPLPAHLPCRDMQPPAFTHLTKGSVRGTQDLGHQYPQPILLVLPALAAGAVVARRKSEDTFCFFFFPTFFFFFPPFPEAKAVFFLPLLLSSLQPPSSWDACKAGRSASAPLPCKQYETGRTKRKRQEPSQAAILS